MPIKGHDTWKICPKCGRKGYKFHFELVDRQLSLRDFWTVWRCKYCKYWEQKK